MTNKNLPALSKKSSVVKLSKDEYLHLVEKAREKKYYGKRPRFETRGYTDEEVRLIEKTFITTKKYNDCRSGHFLRARDLSIFRLSICLGGRPLEMLRMRWEDIDWSRNEIVVDPISNKERAATSIIMPQRAKKVLLAWRSVFEQFIVSPFVFPSITTFECMTPDVWRKILSAISKEANVLTEIGRTQSGQPIYNHRPYSTRKTFGQNVYKTTKDPLLLKRALRHKSDNHLSDYIKPQISEVKEALDSVFQ